MAAISIKIGKEVYVYMNGSLLMKKWLDQDYSVVFDGSRPYGKDTLKSITDETHGISIQN